MICIWVNGALHIFVIWWFCILICLFLLLALYPIHLLAYNVYVMMMPINQIQFIYYQFIILLKSLIICHLIMILIVVSYFIYIA